MFICNSGPADSAAYAATMAAQALTKRAGYSKDALTEDIVRVCVHICVVPCAQREPQITNAGVCADEVTVFRFLTAMLVSAAGTFCVQSGLEPCEGWLKKMSHKGSWQNRYFVVSTGWRISAERTSRRLPWPGTSTCGVDERLKCPPNDHVVATSRPLLRARCSCATATSITTPERIRVNF